MKKKYSLMTNNLLKIDKIERVDNNKSDERSQREKTSKLNGFRIIRNWWKRSDKNTT